VRQIIGYSERTSEQIDREAPCCLYPVIECALAEVDQWGGAVGPTALAVLHSLIFDFLNHRTGRLDPSYAAIARKAGVCVRTVATALARLRELGILNWVRRCAESWRDGRFVLEQETNAYAVLPERQWRGYRAPQEPPGPAPGYLGGTSLDACQRSPRQSWRAI
jgi:hypothetical protein